MGPVTSGGTRTQMDGAALEQGSGSLEKAEDLTELLVNLLRQLSFRQAVV